MKKYLVSIFALLLLAVVAPMTIQAKTTDQTKAELFYYTPPQSGEKLSANDMASAQAIGKGSSVTVDFRAEDFKIYRLDTAANQLLALNWAKEGDGQAD